MGLTSAAEGQYLALTGGACSVSLSLFVVRLDTPLPLSLPSK